MQAKVVSKCVVLTGVCIALYGCQKGEEMDVAESSTPEVPPVVTETGNPDMADAPIVTVNDATLTRAEAQSMAAQLAARQGVPPQMLQPFMAQRGDELIKQAAEQFVNHQLLRAEAASRDFKVSEEDVNGVMAKLAQSLPEGMTIEQALQQQGMTLEQLKDDVKANERVRMLYEAETADVAAPTDEEVGSFYTENTQHFVSKESVEARHILIKCDADADDEARAAAKREAEAVRKSLVEGADFAETALAKSSCPSKEQGGSLGSFGRGRMVPEFDEAAFSQKVGEIGDVVKTQYGYHIIEVTDKTAASTQSLDEVSEAITQHLESQAKDKVFETFIEGLHDGAQITYAEGFEPVSQ